MYSICEQCFHNCVCEKYKVAMDFPRYGCAYANNHFVPADKVVVKGKRNSRKTRVAVPEKKYSGGQPYNVNHIADFILSAHNALGKPINNLRLQYMLYAAWVEYYRKTGQTLFDDKFCVRNFGVMCQEVYYRFCEWGGMDIETAEYAEIETLASADRRVLRLIIERYSKISTNALSDWVRDVDSPWDNCFSSDVVESEMPLETIKRLARTYDEYLRSK